jgi:hypothetical protein
MTHAPETHEMSLGLGLTSTVLGTVGLLLFFMPVLGVPLAIVGLLFGLAGFLLAMMRGWTGLRWAVAGIVICGLALAIGAAVALAPSGYVPTPAVPLDTQPVPDRVYVPPPARPDG